MALRRNSSVNKAVKVVAIFRGSTFGMHWADPLLSILLLCTFTLYRKAQMVVANFRGTTFGMHCVDPLLLLLYFCSHALSLFIERINQELWTQFIDIFLLRCGYYVNWSIKLKTTIKNISAAIGMFAFRHS